MIKKETKSKMVEQSIVVDVVCNQCGNSCLETLSETDIKDFYGASVSASGGYCSRHLSDGVNYSFDLCEKCLSELIKGLKIPPTQVDY